VMFYTLLQNFKIPEQLNARGRIAGRTALHLAVQVANVDGAKELARTKEVYFDVKDENGETPGDMARRRLMLGETLERTYHTQLAALLP
jgi:hypothetical protein